MKNAQGKWLTGALFIEMVPASHRKHCLYTLKDDDITVDGVEYKSLRRLFMEEAEDPTEYTFAKKYLGGWAHWKEMMESQQLQDHVQEWRDERDVYLRSKGIRTLVEQGSGAEASYQAAKWLADKGWAEPKGKGRPTKAAVDKEVKQQAAAKARAKADLKRLQGVK